MPYCWFYTCTFAEEFMFFQPLITAVRFPGYIGNDNLRPVKFLPASISSITGQYFNLSSSQPFRLFQCGLDGMPVIFIAKGHGSKNDSCDRTYEGYLVAEFVFLMFFALADTLHVRLMDGINLFPAVPPLRQNGFKEPEQSVIVMVP